MSAGAAAETVLAAERPLSTRSVLISALLGSDPPAMSGRALVRLGDAFGIAAGTVRTALHRMVSAGEAELVDGRYHLGPRLRRRLDRQRASRIGSTIAWDGRWELAVATPGPRDAATRSDLRAAAAELRLAAHRDGVWMRPANLEPGRAPEATAVLATHCDRFDARPTAPAAGLAAALWDTEDWARRARLLLDAMAETRDGLSADGGPLAAAFVLSAAVLRHLQADPLLPAPLCGPRWPGSLLRSEYEDYERTFQAGLAAWTRATRSEQDA